MKNKKKIILIDYGVGNILSIKNAINYLGHEVKLSSNILELESASHVILPGVGSFPSAINKLSKIKLIETIKKIALSEVFILGICLGMQLLFSRSFEFKETPGLKILEGDIKFLQDIKNLKSIKLPHIGWNNLIIGKNISNPILKNITSKDYFYFIHSYAAFNTKNNSNNVFTKYNGIYFPAIVQNENVFGCQFHPEKSSKSGLKILKNFIDL